MLATSSSHKGKTIAAAASELFQHALLVTPGPALTESNVARHGSQRAHAMGQNAGKFKEHHLVSRKPCFFPIWFQGGHLGLEGPRGPKGPFGLEGPLRTKKERTMIFQKQGGVL